MTATVMKATGIVLAGGRSARFDAPAGVGGSKLAADLGGRSVLRRTVEVVRSVCATVIVVGTVPDQWSPLAKVWFVAEPVSFGGPVAGIRTGLEAVSGQDVLVVGGDMPLLVPEVLRRMLATLRVRPGIQAVTLAHADLIEPLPCALDAEAARAAVALSTASPNRSLTSFLGRLRRADVPESAWRALDPEGDSLLDIDTPADLEQARSRLRA